MLAFCLLFLIASICHGITVSTPDDDWHRPGCYRVGHSRRVSIKECISFNITTNACRGFCDSYALPSDPRNAQPVTSIGTCCNIMETTPIEVRVLCKDGIRVYVFKSAVSCACYHCKKD